MFARRLLGVVLFFTGRCSPLSFEVDLSKPLMLLASFQGATHGNASRERFFFCVFETVMIATGARGGNVQAGEGTRLAIATACARMVHSG